MTFSFRQLRSVFRLALGGLFILAAFGGTEGYAQSGIRSVESISQGGSVSALGASTSALYTNPANLTVGSTGGYEVRLLDIRGYTGGDLFQFNHYNETFASGQTLTSDRVNQTLDSWFGDKQRSGATYLDVVPLSFTYRPEDTQWAVGGGLRIRSGVKTSVNRGLFDLLLRGTEPERTVPVNGRYHAVNTIDVTGAFSYAFESIPLSVGVSPRVIFGTGYADGELTSEVTLNDEAYLHEFDYTARAAGMLSREVYDGFNAFRPSPMQDASFQVQGEVAGLGAGIDLGGTYEVQPGLFVSMSVTDLGWIRWNNDAQTVTPQNNEFRFEGIELNRQQLRSEFDGDVPEYVRHQVDSLARAAYQDVDRERAPFVTGLPTAVQMNGTWNRGRYTVTGGTAVGFNSAAGTVSPTPAFHTGGEVQFGPVPLRAGVRLFGTQAATFAGGAGLHLGAYRFDIGVSVTPSTSFLGSGARYAIGVSLATIQF